MIPYECLKIIAGGQEQPKRISGPFCFFHAYSMWGRSLLQIFRYKMHAKHLNCASEHNGIIS